MPRKASQHRSRDHAAVDGLLCDHRDVVLQRHRRGPDVAAAIHGVSRVVAARVGQAVAQLGFEAARERTSTRPSLRMKFSTWSRTGPASASLSISWLVVQHAGARQMLGEQVGQERE